MHRLSVRVCLRMLLVKLCFSTKGYVMGDCITSFAPSPHVTDGSGRGCLSETVSISVIIFVYIIIIFVSI